MSKHETLILLKIRVAADSISNIILLPNCTSRENDIEIIIIIYFCCFTFVTNYYQNMFVLIKENTRILCTISLVHQVWELLLY